MAASILTIPGYRGSDEQHWQSWLEQQLPDEVVRVSGIDWDVPILSDWAGQIRKTLHKSPAPLWLVAHSFGCLASAVAVADLPEKVAGVIFVAPADPKRFSVLGCHDEDDHHSEEGDLDKVMPGELPGVHGVLMASRNDPWLAVENAHRLAAIWGLELLDLGEAGHVNVESGFGPWPQLLELVSSMQTGHVQPIPDERHSVLIASASAKVKMKAGRGSALARVRQLTRHLLDRRFTNRS